jgi:DNA-binding MarR family transcriptional regulator
MQMHTEIVEMLHAELPAAGFADVRPPHCQVLRRIEPDGSRLTDLAAAARMTKQSMSALVDHLEAGGYIARVPDPTDGRVRPIRLTALGRRAVQAIDALSASLEAEWSEKVGTRRLEQLRSTLMRLAQP